MMSLTCRVQSAQHVQDEHHFIFDCPLYSHTRARHATPLQQTLSVSHVVARYEPNARGGFVRCLNPLLFCPP